MVLTLKKKRVYRKKVRPASIGLCLLVVTLPFLLLQMGQHYQSSAATQRELDQQLDQLIETEKRKLRYNYSPPMVDGSFRAALELFYCGKGPDYEKLFHPEPQMHKKYKWPKASQDADKKIYEVFFKHLGKKGTTNFT
jgi:hypothetical protein